MNEPCNSSPDGAAKPRACRARPPIGRKPSKRLAAADEPEEEAIYAGVTRRLIRECGIAPDRLRREADYSKGRCGTVRLATALGDRACTRPTGVAVCRR